MNSDLLPINLYHKYRQDNCVPFLLESRGPKTPYSDRTILGVKPKRKLLCVNGELIENGKTIGEALDIFSHMKVKNNGSFFPAWLGFFNYEFARNFGLPTKNAGSAPEAVFYYYEEGHVFLGDQVIEGRVPASLDPIIRDEKKEVTPFLDNYDSFTDAYNKVASSITHGDVYQVNLAKRFNFDAIQIDFFELYRRMQTSNPSPFMGLCEDDDWAIACASPERLFKLQENTLSSRPIAGTRPRGKTQGDDRELQDELLSCPKERAEHAMLVDLVRNDLARVCQTGTVKIDEGFIVERYCHVMHLVSEVSGKSTACLQEVFEALFPAGTITGTPKESAMEHIRDLEPFARGPYTGSMGYISGKEGVDFNIMIRSAFRNGNTGHIWAGAGIVANSKAPTEGNEVASKANSVCAALQNKPSPSQAMLPVIGTLFETPKARKHFSARVVFVENHDSFSHNIIDAVKRLGCSVEVVDHLQKPKLTKGKHVILGPGPKSPTKAGFLVDWLKAAIDARCPVLGICLGHQALAQHFGADLVEAHRAIHGETHKMEHRGHPLFDGVEKTFLAMRYHSLVATKIPACFDVVAYSASDEVMAIAHKTLPLFGVQFHPESFLSENGERLFSNFFEMTT